MKKQIREQDIYYFDSGEQEDTALCAGMLRQMIAEIMRRENRKGVLLFCIGTYKTICKLVPIARIGNVKMQANSYLLKGVTVEAASVLLVR